MCLHGWVSNSEGLVWGLDSVILTGSQVMLMLLVWRPCFENQYFSSFSFVIKPTFFLTYKALQELGPGFLSAFIGMCLFPKCFSFWSCNSLSSFLSQSLFIECLQDDSSAGFSLIIISHPCLLMFQFSYQSPLCAQKNASFSITIPIS